MPSRIVEAEELATGLLEAAAPFSMRASASAIRRCVAERLSSFRERDRTKRALPSRSVASAMP